MTVVMHAKANLLLYQSRGPPTRRQRRRIYTVISKRRTRTNPESLIWGGGMFYSVWCHRVLLFFKWTFGAPRDTWPRAESLNISEYRRKGITYRRINKYWIKIEIYYDAEFSLRNFGKINRHITASSNFSKKITQFPSKLVAFVILNKNANFDHHIYIAHDFSFYCHLFDGRYKLDEYVNIFLFF